MSDPRPAAPRSKRGRLTRSADFDRVFRRGRSYGNRYLVLHVFPQEASEHPRDPRVGLSVSRRVGNAVERNLVKRLLREACAQHVARFSGTVDLVIVGRRPHAFTTKEAARWVVFYIAFGLVLALVWVRLEAPDLALAEAAIGAGVIGAMLLDAARQMAGDDVDRAGSGWGPARRTGAALVTLAFFTTFLVGRLRAGGFELLDTQFITDHLRRFGAVEVPREAYQMGLRRAVGRVARFPRDDQPFGLWVAEGASAASPSGVAGSAQCSTQTS